ncbi:MAG: hypothetical protein Nkreftii_003818 [Candidatus Nitrospira kreftii]|uniref:Uncharacterized protein n=1 Tax=Candidatus Nitrospira kreftii TaxID=2652173 RepID=A0A7S8J1U8_9BACT|nr:MAG: hypothetical protein Nkreftii_003818 [Candidatus Nitrospira kreftii]
MTGGRLYLLARHASDVAINQYTSCELGEVIVLLGAITILFEPLLV